MHTTSAHPHVVVIGGGFGGMAAVRRLARTRARVTLVDRHNHHVFQPLLYQVATASLAAPQIAAPLRAMLRRQTNAEVLLDEVTAIEPQAHRVRLGSGHVLDYDYLVVASGVTHAYFGHDDWAAFAPGLKTLDDALAIRRRVLLAFEYAERETDAAQRQAWLNFVVVGAGPTGVELAGTLAELARHTLHPEYRHVETRRSRIILAEAGPRVLGTYPEALSAKARRQLEHLGVEVRTDSPITHIDRGGVAFGDARLAARTVLWAAGVAASPLGSQLGVPLDRVGRVQVAPDLSLPAHPDVFVIGDLAHVPQADGRLVPGIAPAAKQMGHYVGDVLGSRLRQGAAPAPAPAPFHYRDAGSLATIGRHAAVARLGRSQLSGALAWWTWLVAHIWFLIGFRNRLVVMLDWAWSYLTWHRHARIVITPDPKPPAPGAE